MKLSIKTDTLKEMVSKVVKGAGLNKLVPLTSMLAIELKSNILTMHTTDMSNHLYINHDKIAGEDFYVTVGVEQFSKLIGKMTCENVTLELKGNSLEVKGNGTYNIELPLDENGNLIKFPNPYTMPLPSVGTIELTTVKAILNTAKQSLATTLEIPCYTGYYVGDKVIATDTYKICGMNIKLFDEPVLISSEMMDLLDVIDTEKIDVGMNDDIITFTTPDCAIYGYKMEGLEDFSIDAINGLLDTEFDSVCKVSKTAMLALLDRIALFVGTYDNKAINLTFTANGIDISSKNTSGVETIDYVESQDFKPFTCNIDIDMLTSQIKANPADVVELHYGNDKFVSITNGNTILIISLLEDDE